MANEQRTNFSVSHATDGTHKQGVYDRAVFDVEGRLVYQIDGELVLQNPEEES